MKHLNLIILAFFCTLATTVRAQYYSVNYDEKTVLNLSLHRENGGEIGVRRGNFAHGFIQLVEIGTSLLRSLLSLAELT